MVGHYNKTMHCAFCSVEVKASFHDLISGCFWKMPAVVGGKGREDGLIVFLIVRERAAILVLAEHSGSVAMAEMALQ